MFRLIFWLALVAALCFLNLGMPWFWGVFVWLATVTLFLGAIDLNSKRRGRR